MDELEFTEEEFARVVRACAWVKATTGFLPYLREFVATRLRHQSALAGRVARLSPRQTFRLWEHLRDEQAAPRYRPEQPAGRAAPSTRHPSQR